MPQELHQAREHLTQAARILIAHAAKLASHHDFGPKYIADASAIASDVARANADIDRLARELVPAE